MRGPSINKGPSSARSNLVEYQQACRDFGWSDAEGLLSFLPEGRGLNIAHEAVDRHAQGLRASKVALRFVGQSSTHDLSYAQLAALTNRFANVLGRLGLQQGERVFTLLGRVPELYVAALGTLKAGCVLSPLFSAFGPEPIQTRMTLGSGRVLVTTEKLYKKKVAPLRAELSSLQHVLLVDGDGREPGTLRLADLLEAASDRFTIPPTDPEQLALLHFTSGTTGKPKGAMHVHKAVVVHHLTGKLALDLHDDDVFWCTADPGWVTGTSYGIIAPLTNGVTSVVDEADFMLNAGTASCRNTRSASGTPRRPRSGC